MVKLSELFDMGDPDGIGAIDYYLNSKVLLNSNLLIHFIDVNNKCFFATHMLETCKTALT